jgi:hypothetical protein
MWPRSGSAGSCTSSMARKRDRAVQRHRLDGTDEVPRRRRRDFLLAGNEGPPRGRAFQPDDTVIVLAGQQPQRKSNHAAGVAQTSCPRPKRSCRCWSGRGRRSPASPRERGISTKIGARGQGLQAPAPVLPSCAKPGGYSYVPSGGALSRPACAHAPAILDGPAMSEEKLNFRPKLRACWISSRTRFTAKKRSFYEN